MAYFYVYLYKLGEHFGEQMGYMRYSKYYLLTIVTIVFFGIRVYAQSETNISGVINSYVDVVTVGVPNDSSITVSSSAAFSVGDTVMLIQMKGADVKSSTSGDMDNPNSSGKYEFLIISSVNANQITFSSDLLNVYDPLGLVQLIHVPGYRNANVESNLTCADWNGTTGGVLTFMVHDTLKLNSTINVSGKGFLGADTVYSPSGLCTAVPESYFINGEFLPETADSVGSKGEGVAIKDITKSRGYGRWINGGGGGKGRFAGGGGGCNIGIGGAGGYESDYCTTIYIDTDAMRGRGGRSLSLYDSDSTIYLGGGGGSGISYGSDKGSNAGDGGGIIVILANVIIGNNQNIIADGESVTTVVTGSGGGGGGGGSILLEINSFTGNLTVEAKGGKGGDTNHPTYFIGGGGGAGGGLIRFSSGSLPVGISTDLAGGLQGESLIIQTRAQATAGTAGNYEYNLRVPLNGFLFNTILKDQTICENTAPDALIGSSPRGSLDSTYLWQSSNDLIAWASASGTNNEQHYFAGTLTDTTYFRRIIESTNFNLERFQDTSNIVKITVQPAISNNSILDLDTICYGSTPTALTGSIPVGGDGISYAYDWESSTDQASWGGVGILQNYAPGTLTDTTYYHRIVSSGTCIDTSNQVEIMVYDTIINNLISPIQTICEKNSFSILNGTTPQNGDGSYNYKWEASVDNSDWRDTIINNTTRDYLPLEEALFYPNSVYYRRTVYSGYNDCCQDISTSLMLTVLPEIKNNVIESNQTICYGTSPASLTTAATPLTDGSGTYTFVWQNSLDDAIWSNVAGTNENYQSGNLIQNTYFRRIVNSGACSDSSASIFVDLRPLPTANITSFLDTICSGSSVNLTFNIAGINPPWELTYTNGSVSTLLSGISSSPHGITVNPTTLDEEQEFLFSVVSVVDSENCEATDITGEKTTIVYGLPNANAGENDSICGIGYTLNSIPSVGNGLWTTINATFSDSSQYNSNVTADGYGIYSFIWTETNWECPESSDNVSIEFFEEPLETDAGIDTTIFFNDTITLRANAPSVGIGTWSLIDGSGTINDINDSITKIIELVQGDNVFRWTVANGNCPEHYDEIMVSVEDITAPKGFSPNGDGSNDFLTISGLQNNPKIETCKFIVFNRWGNKIYETIDKDFQWDGTYNNNAGEELPEDTYYYILEVNGTNSYKGFFIIKRQ